MPSTPPLITSRGLRVLKSFVGAIRVSLGDFELGLDVDPERGHADSGDLEADLPELLVAIAEAAGARNTAVAIIIDELQYLESADSLIQYIVEFSPMCLF